MVSTATFSRKKKAIDDENFVSQTQKNQKFKRDFLIGDFEDDEDEESQLVTQAIEQGLYPKSRSNESLDFN